MASNNSWNNTISDAAVTLNGGAVSIGTDATSNAINIGTGAAARTVTIGNTTGASAVNIDIGTGDFTLDSATGNIITVADTGEINYPLQPAFLAILDVTLADVTGDGTLYTVIFDNEVYDQGDDLNIGTSVFTAPKTGRYALEVGLLFGDLAAGHTNGAISIVTSNRQYQNSTMSYGAAMTVSNQLALSQSVCADMDASDTAHITALVSGGALVVDLVSGGATNPLNYFSGHLVA